MIDADVNELPTNATMTIDRARISSGDTVPYRTDATEPQLSYRRTLSNI
jgi:hypothetical protein